VYSAAVMRGGGGGGGLGLIDNRDIFGARNVGCGWVHMFEWFKEGR